MASEAATMTEQEAIKMHLFEDRTRQGVRRYRGFGAILKDARRVTGRNRDTGQLECPNHAGSWIGAVGYMILLDQIGACFKPRSRNQVDENNIYKALRYFTNLKENEIWAIYALRCALAHDYSLYNQNKKHPERQHWFAVSAGGNTLVKLPAKPWDGDYHNQDSQCLTEIDLQKLGDLVEDIVQTLDHVNQQNQLEIVLSGGKDELNARYTNSARRILSMII